MALLVNLGAHDEVHQVEDAQRQRRPRAHPPWKRTALLLAGASVAVVALFVATTTLLREEPPSFDITLARPATGEVRADYLPDGTPVWVIGHDDGGVSVISAFDTHTPLNLGKLNWWCPPADGIENPAHGSRWDEYGVKIGGPAPLGLPSWEVRVVGATVAVGQPLPGPPLGTPFLGDEEPDRTWCVPPAGRVILHRFEDWPVWDSPTDAVAAAPDTWILLDGRLTVVGAQVRLCALTGCEDSVVATGLGIPSPEVVALGDPFPSTRWLARVRDGRLVDVTQLAFDPAA